MARVRARVCKHHTPLGTKEGQDEAQSKSRMDQDDLQGLQAGWACRWRLDLQLAGAKGSLVTYRKPQSCSEVGDLDPINVTCVSGSPHGGRE